MKIVWAIDPFDNQLPLAPMYSMLTALAGKDGVQVVYVAGHGEARLSTAFDVPEKERFGKFPLGLLRKALADAGLPLSPRRVAVVEEESASMKAAAGRLDTWAREQGADAVALFSHAKKGVKRLMLGSFAETFVHHATLPVLVANPTTRIPEAPQRLVFAHDLGKRDTRALAQLAHLPPTLGLQLFHAAPPQAILGQPALTGDMDKAWEQALEEAERKLSVAARQLAGRTVVVEARPADGKISDAILAQARRTKADLIGVAAQSGPLRAMFLGSVTRELLRASPLPVLICKG